MAKTAKRYSVYETKDDTPVIIYASAELCAKALGVKTKTFYRYITRKHAGECPPQKWDIYEDDPSNTPQEFCDNLLIGLT